MSNCLSTDRIVACEYVVQVMKITLDLKMIADTAICAFDADSVNY